MARWNSEEPYWDTEGLEPEEMRERMAGEELTPRERRRIKEDMDELKRKEEDRLRRFYLCRR